MDRIEYFHNTLKERGVTSLDVAAVQSLIHEYAMSCPVSLCASANRLSYIHQNDEEYEEIKKARRPGRPASNREDQLKRKMDTLEEEYEKGFRTCLNLHSFEKKVTSNLTQ